jgi:CheY-like chemotaxis protein
MRREPVLLVVDDEPYNRDIIAEFLERDGYRIDQAADGREALDRLTAEPRRYDALLLDRMMPVLDGMSVLREVKRDPVLRSLPVIVQTAAAGKEQVSEGLAAGAYYYLTKPFEPEMLRSIVRAAVNASLGHRALRIEAEERARVLGGLQSARFTLRTLTEARALAVLIAAACPQPQSAVVGISELLINAVEHGLAGVGYERKGALLDAGDWEAEVERRLRLPENEGRSVEVQFVRDPDAISLTVRDPGPGFDWRRYLEFDPGRAFDSHGRGIAMARQLAFAHIEYRGNGNEVHAQIACAERV